MNQFHILYLCKRQATHMLGKTARGQQDAIGNKNNIFIAPIDAIEVLHPEAQPGSANDQHHNHEQNDEYHYGSWNALQSETKAREHKKGFKEEET